MADDYKTIRHWIMVTIKTLKLPLSWVRFYKAFHCDNLFTSFLIFQVNTEFVGLVNFSFDELTLAKSELTKLLL
jgi:hypothetical protein